MMWVVVILILLFAGWIWGATGIIWTLVLFVVVFFLSIL